MNMHRFKIRRPWRASRRPSRAHDPHRPETIYWPVFIVATLAAIVASQATISATFSIIKQALALGCFPRVKDSKTKAKLAMLTVDQGGWVPLVISAAFFIIMYVWHYGTLKRYEFEMHSKVSMAWILGLGPSLGLVRVPGIGLVCTELASGVPHIFSHFITNLPARHSAVIFVCVKYLPVYTVPEDERFLVKRIGPKNFHIFCCVARYGYKDLHKKDDEFEKKLFDNLFTFVCLE
ncbi:K+ uptake permease 10 [Actinidia rufa]|uniref:K+ uptake permease 10 n=1 Tax=Actinidia rufa TaxID=165716 RepID=A0A7J0D8L0_9ERIC|nr:K+ uptake permease 10 [Actinidia rufa]